MPSHDICSEIGRVLSENDTALVVAALRQDPLVWKSLEDRRFRSLAVERAGSEISGWSPGRLGLLAINDSRTPDVLCGDPLPTLGQSLQEKVLQAYQNMQRNPRQPATLAEASLLALALRERRRLTGSWSGLLTEILPKPALAAGVFDFWRAPLACLYAMVPDPEVMLRALLPKFLCRPCLEWITRSQISQPVTAQAHQMAFQNLLRDLPVAYQLTLLRSLSTRGLENLASELADRLLIGHPAFTTLRDGEDTHNIDLPGLSARALSLQQMGAFYHLAGDRLQALSLLNAAEITLKQWLAGLYLQRLDLQIGEENQSSAVLMESGQVAHLAASAEWLKNDLGVVLVSHPYANSIMDQSLGDFDSPFLQIRRARMMVEREPAIAHDLARQGAAGLIEAIKRFGIPFQGDFVYSWHPQDAVKILLELDLPQEALNLSLALLHVRPTDPSLLHLSSKIYERLGRLDEAVNIALQLTALEPGNPSWRRCLGNLFGQMENWEASLRCWKDVISLTPQPVSMDRLSCARAAINAKETDQAAALAEDVLKDEPNNGLALGLLGKALLEQNEIQQAVNLLVRATLLAPDVLDHWLTLAAAQQLLGDPQPALQTLHAAVAAIPDSAEAHLALGQVCVRMAMPAQALPHLQQAFQLAPDNQQAALFYAHTLRVLGHPADARTILERVRECWTGCPELAFEYAQVLLDLNDSDSALPVLEMALRHGLPVLDGSLLYARILLGLREGEEAIENPVSITRLQQASQALQHILEIEPNNLEARFLMAEMLREKGELQQAVAQYRSLADIPALEAMGLRWRVQWGLGRAALGLGQADTALAAFQEASLQHPDHLPLQRSLAEASRQANLLQEALDAAAHALQIASDDVHNLSWYAGFMARMGELRRAADTLRRAVQIEPERADLQVSLAQSLLSAGDIDGARSAVAALGTMETATMEDMRQAGQVYLRLEDTESALECFERALSLSGNPSPDLLCEAAELHARQGSPEVALELAQKALDDTPERLPVYLLTAGLLVDLDRPQAAQAMLERALRIAQSHPESTLTPLQSEIHQRFTELMLADGNLSAALHHAEKAFLLQPDRAGLCVCAVELAQALLQTERATRLAASFVYQGAEYSTASSEPDQASTPTAIPVERQVALLLEQGQHGLDLICLLAELALAKDNQVAASALYENAQPHAGDYPRLLAIQIRLLARQPVIDAAAALLNRLIDPGEEAPAQPVGGLWLGQAALEAQRWQTALHFFEQYASLHPGQAWAQLSLARALVLSAEQQRLCQQINCTQNAPGPQALDAAHQVKFEEAIRAAARLANAPEVLRWQARGQAVFAPSPQTARALAGLSPTPSDAAALISVLRVLKNFAAAKQVANRYQDDAGVLLQLALCALSEPDLEGLSLTERALNANPANPLALVIHGQLAARLGELFTAQQSYLQALNIWSNEPKWHDAAGDLCLQIGEVSQGIHHRRQALDLTPNCSQYAYKLGQACLADEKLPDAIEYLERACALDANHACAWLELATAYHLAGRLSPALEAATKAADLDPISAQGLLVAGETALSLQKLSLALDFARDAYRREPENAAAVLFLTNVLVQNDQPQEALMILEAAAAPIKALYPVAFERAKLIRRLHGPQASLEVLEKLAKEYPEEPGLLACLARTQAECGQLKSAERYAFKALRLDPEQPELTLMLGRIQHETGQLDQAVQLLSDAIRLSPENLEAYLELATVYQERREFNLAQDVYQQAIRTAPGDYQAYYQSGLIFRDGKDYAAAEDMLRRAADLAPDNLTIRRQLVGVITLNLVHSHQEVG
jgi:tetratricopeptide (TPR) repeat protein